MANDTLGNIGKKLAAMKMSPAVYLGEYDYEATEDAEELRNAKENARRRFRLRQRQQRAHENS